MKEEKNRGVWRDKKEGRKESDNIVITVVRNGGGGSDGDSW